VRFEVESKKDHGSICNRLTERYIYAHFLKITKIGNKSFIHSMTSLESIISNSSKVTVLPNVLNPIAGSYSSLDESLNLPLKYHTRMSRIALENVYKGVLGYVPAQASIWLQREILIFGKWSVKSVDSESLMVIFMRVPWLYNLFTQVVYKEFQADTGIDLDNFVRIMNENTTLPQTDSRRKYISSTPAIDKNYIPQYVSGKFPALMFDIGKIMPPDGAKIGLKGSRLTFRIECQDGSHKDCYLTSKSARILASCLPEEFIGLIGIQSHVLRILYDGLAVRNTLFRQSLSVHIKAQIEYSGYIKDVKPMHNALAFAIQSTTFVNHLTELS